MAINIGSQYKTMQEIVYESIKDGIIKGVYVPGQRLITADLAAEMGVSRMPVREALQRLDASTGLVTVIPHKGAIVNDFSSENDIDEVYDLRALLEGMAVRLACNKMTDQDVDKLESINNNILALEGTTNEEYFQELNQQFHSVIWAAAESPRLVKILQMLYDASRGYRYISLKLPGRLDKIVNEHRDIIEVLRKKQPLLAEEIMRGHYIKTKEWLVRSYRDNLT